MNSTDIYAFSDGCLACFKLCHSIRRFDVFGEQKSSNHGAAEKCWDIFASLTDEHDLTVEQVYNVDETHLYWLYST